MTVKTCDWRNPLHPSPSLPEHWQEERDEPSPRSSPALLRSPSSPPSWSPSPSPPPPPPPGPPSSSSRPLPPPPQRMVGRMSERLGSVGWNEELRFIFFLPNISVLNIGAHVLCSCVSSRVIVHNGHCAFKLALGHASYKTIAVNSFQFVRLFFKSINIKVIILNEPKTNCDQKSSQGVFVKASSLLSSSPRKITITIMITMKYTWIYSVAIQQVADVRGRAGSLRGSSLGGIFASTTSSEKLQGINEIDSFLCILMSNYACKRHNHNHDHDIMRSKCEEEREKWIKSKTLTS